MNHQPKKRFGQNFLRDKNLLKKIVQKANLKDQNVIEIGPGQGALTEFLVLDAKKVVAFEIDYSLKPILNQIVDKHPNLEVVYKDFLETDLNEYKAYHAIGNIPYYITTPIIFKILESKQILSATLMMQKEVGERLTAIPNTKGYNALSVILQSTAQVKKIVDVNKKMFYPVPKVDSVVIQFHFDLEKEIDDMYIAFVKTSFTQKRKTLMNNLAQGYQLDKSLLTEFFKEMNLDLNLRAEQVSVIEFIEIYQSFVKII